MCQIHNVIFPLLLPPIYILFLKARFSTILLLVSVDVVPKCLILLSNITALFSTDFTFLPFSQPYMTKGFEILKSAPTEFWWAVLIVFSGSFGMSTLKNIKGKK